MQRDRRHNRVLIVDDSEDHVALVKHLLTSEGYSVDVARTGPEGLELIRSSCPSLVILDVMLPGLNGVQLLQTLRQDPATAQVPVIVCSAKDYRPELKLAGELGAVDFITKPIIPADFRRRIDRFFEEGASALRTEPEVMPLQSPEVYRPQLILPDTFLRFWGTRGSLPVSGRPYVVHGGDTSCMEMRVGDDLLIFDAGTGIRSLGVELLKTGPRRIHLFIGHTHWDHIQGFPFFSPAYIPGFEIHMYGAPGFGKDLRAIIQGQQDRDYFPIQFEDMRAKLEVHVLDESPVRIGDSEVSWHYVHHPGAAVGFRVKMHGKVIAYISDNEFAKGWLGNPGTLVPGHPVVVSSEALIGFVRDVDVLVHEAQYTNEEYPTKIGWGHSSLSNACALAKLGGVKRWIVTHHDPAHTDDQLSSKILLTRQVLAEVGHKIEVVHAYDGFVDPQP